MKVDGGCFCGAVTYEAEVDPTKVVICHCTDCQTNSGTAYGVVVVVVDDSFSLQTGSLKSFEKVADSGQRRELAFCPECGTRIYARPADGTPGVFGLRAGTVTQREALKPIAQLWRKSALPWTQDISSLPSFDGQPTVKP